MTFDFWRTLGLSRLAARSGLFACVVVGLSPAAYAQDRIGVAALIRNEVSHGSRTSPRPLGVGDGVVRMETVRTGPESVAKLVFRDDTNLSIGPRAVISLDEAVFSDSPRASLGVRLVEGAVRYVSGKLPKENYKIETPTATIGIRGTEFDLDATRTVTTVTLRAGIVVACTRRAIPQRCVTLNNPGDTAVISSNAARMGGPGSGIDFAQFCAGAPGLCTASSYAQGPGGPVIAALCGR